MHFPFKKPIIHAKALENSDEMERVEHCGKALFLKWSFLRVGGLKREAF